MVVFDHYGCYCGRKMGYGYKGRLTFSNYENDTTLYDKLQAFTDIVSSLENFSQKSDTI
jgi:hypothetical protein